MCVYESACVRVCVRACVCDRTCVFMCLCMRSTRLVYLLWGMRFSVTHVTLSSELRANNLSVPDRHQLKMPFDDPALSKGHRRPSLSLSNYWCAAVQGGLNSGDLGFC